MSRNLRNMRLFCGTVDGSLLDHLVGLRLQRQRHDDAESLCGSHVDDERTWSAAQRADRQVLRPQDKAGIAAGLWYPSFMLAP